MATLKKMHNFYIGHKSIDMAGTLAHRRLAETSETLLAS